MMKTRYPLRNAEPRTFISYSFSDREIADRLNFYLSEHGFQVHMEDETSLLGQNLTEALPLRIGDCEVFIPLLTKMANDSTWMRKEFDWALAHQGMHPYRLILPVVFDRDYLYQPLHDWVYVDATSSGLTQDLLALIAREFADSRVVTSFGGRYLSIRAREYSNDTERCSWERKTDYRGF